MSFLLPDTFSKPDLTTTTQKAYTRYLNKLADEGFNTPELLKTQAEEIVDTIFTLYPGDDEKDRQHRRYFASAIYWVLPVEYRMKSNPYYGLVKKSRPPVDGEWDNNKKRYLAKKAMNQG